jgi:hypothetical protein
MRTHKDLKIWQEGLEMVSHVYALTKTFPEFEKYGLASQMQRCTISIPSNIESVAEPFYQLNFKGLFQSWFLSCWYKDLDPSKTCLRTEHNGIFWVNRYSFYYR